MAYFSFKMTSAVLHGNTTVDVILPDLPRGEKPENFYVPGKKFKVLWLLHGGGGDSSDWVRKSSIERYACERELAVIMPDARNSSYNNVEGYPMWDFMNEELMPLVYSYFPVSDKREDNFVAGLSMGGHGTCHWAFACPEKFQGMAAMSCGPFSIVRIMKGEQPLDNRGMMIAKYNGNIEEAEKEDYWYLAKQMMEGGNPVPKMYFAAGTEDPLKTARDMKMFEDYCQEIGLKAKFEYDPGSHNWEFWDEHIQHALKYFFDED